MFCVNVLLELAAVVTVVIYSRLQQACDAGQVAPKNGEGESS